MKAIERLEEQLNERDEKIEELEGKLAEAERAAEEDHTWSKHVEYKAGEEPSPELPVPRLEMRWSEEERNDSYELTARYSLVYRHLCKQIVFVPLGVTRTTGALAERINPNKTVDTPFRDGAHLRNEMAQLGLRAFGIVGDHVREYRICKHCGRLDETHAGRAGAGMDSECTWEPIGP